MLYEGTRVVGSGTIARGPAWALVNSGSMGTARTPMRSAQGARGARGDRPCRGLPTPRHRRPLLVIGIAVGAYAVSFGAIGVATGFTVLQTQALSALMFTGASQFAFVAVMAAGGGLMAAVFTAWLLGVRNGLYALHLATILSPAGRPSARLRGWRRMGAAQFTIDESTAMAMAYEGDPAAIRRAFWATGWSVFLLWNLGTLLGAVGAAAVRDPRMLGLDAAIPAGFLALLWPRLVDRSAWALAVAAGCLALAWPRCFARGSRCSPARAWPWPGRCG